MDHITHGSIRTNGIAMHVAEKGEGLAVVLCHGFPELWYSWRHQLKALADAGFHAIAPDQRGYGRTDRPQAVEEYDILHLTDDLLGLLDALGEDQAVFVGHDWGAAVVWNLALRAPERVRAVAATPRTLGVSGFLGYCGAGVLFFPLRPFPDSARVWLQPACRGGLGARFHGPRSRLRGAVPPSWRAVFGSSG